MTVSGGPSVAAAPMMPSTARATIPAITLAATITASTASATPTASQLPGVIGRVGLVQPGGRVGLVHTAGRVHLSVGFRVVGALVVMPCGGSIFDSVSVSAAAAKASEVIKSALAFMFIGVK